MGVFVYMYIEGTAGWHANFTVIFYVDNNNKNKKKNVGNQVCENYHKQNLITIHYLPMFNGNNWFSLKMSKKNGNCAVCARVYNKMQAFVHLHMK